MERDLTVADGPNLVEQYRRAMGAVDRGGDRLVSVRRRSWMYRTRGLRPAEYISDRRILRGGESKEGV